MKSNSAGVLHWAESTPVKVYIDPASFSPDEVKAIQAGVQAWVATGAFSQVTFTTVDPGRQALNGNVRITEGKSTTLAVTSAYTSAPSGSTSNVITGADINFDHSFQNPDKSKAYSPGSINGGNAFLTLVTEHEFGHVLGADDFKDASGNETDSPGPSVMGAYTGTNNQGYPPTSTALAAPPGNATPITSCDKNTILLSQSDGGGGGGGGHNPSHPVTPAQPPENGGSGGGGDGGDGDGGADCEVDIC